MSTADGPPSGHLAREIGECLRYLSRHRVLLKLTAAATLVNTVYMGQLAVLILLVRQELHLPAALYGVLLTIGALGGVAASMTASHLTEALGRRAILTGGLLVLALSLYFAKTALDRGRSFVTVGGKASSMPCAVVRPCSLDRSRTSWRPSWPY